MADGRSPVIVVHGLWLGPWATALLRRRLARCGFAPLAFGYPSVRGTLEDNARALRRFADAVPGGRLDFVAHSLGGLLVLDMLERFRWSRPGRLVLLGAPVQGSHVARWLMQFSWGRALVGRSVAEWMARAAPSAVGPVEAGVLAGTRPVGLGRIAPGLPLPCDGTVALAETALPGARDSIVMDVSHTAMLISARVARQCCAFLADGRFDHSGVGR